MNILMVRSKVKAAHVTEVEAAVKRVFAALQQAQPQGIRYTSCRLADGVTYVAVLELDEGVDNPLPALPEFRAFQENLKQWMAEPPTAEQLTLIGSYVINKFNVKPEEVEPFLNVWAADAALMKRQPGFISAQLHRGITGSGVFVNYAVWESAEHLKQAYNNPEFQALIAQYPSGVTASPHLFRKVAVPGVCLAD